MEAKMGFFFQPGNTIDKTTAMTKILSFMNPIRAYDGMIHATQRQIV